MPLLTVDEALQRVTQESRPKLPETVRLEDSLGLVLAEPAVSDVDSPPFDKALMDGYAIRSSDCREAETRLSVIEEVTAGRMPTRPVKVGEATRIMTGAPIPDGADAVVRIEDTEFDWATKTVQVRVAVKIGGSVLKRAASVQRGQTVLPAGLPLRAQHLGALAEIGGSTVSVRTPPTVAILATGDELVEIAAKPGPGQIRNSNETMLAAQVRHAGGTGKPLGIARDERSELRAAIQRGLAEDILLLTGGVSAGKLDLVPSELEFAGVRAVFHKVNLKPGKPVWFGIYERPGNTFSGQSSRCLVFGLPGNPVGSLVCFELFVRTAIRCLTGASQTLPEPISARLSQSHVARGDRPTYHPARMSWRPDGPVVETVPWHGSADLCATRNANGMAYFPAGDYRREAGEWVEFYFW